MIKLATLLFEAMNPSEAEYIFARYGVPNASSLSPTELKSAWIGLVKAHHPDKGGKDINMRYINAAYDVLKNPSQSTRNFTASGRPTYARPAYDYAQDFQSQNRTQRKSPWAWAGWSGGAEPMDDYSDSPQNINYVKKQAWEMSGQPTPSKNNEYTFWNWDGSYFRGVVSVFAKQDTDILFKISELVVKWDNFHKSIGVFFLKKTDPRRLFLINLKGNKVDPAKEFSHDSFNNNPGNDKDFVEYLRKSI